MKKRNVRLSSTFSPPPVSFDGSLPEHPTPAQAKEAAAYVAYCLEHLTATEARALAARMNEQGVGSYRAKGNRLYRVKIREERRNPVDTDLLARGVKTMAQNEMMGSDLEEVDFKSIEAELRIWM